MRLMVTLAVLALLTSCAITRGPVNAPFYSSACATTGATGTIAVHPLLNMEDVTVFRASEFTGCPGGRSIVIVSWHGEMTVSSVDLARNVVRRFFNHFHSGDAISFTELDALTRHGISTIIFQFAVETPGAI